MSVCVPWVLPVVRSMQQRWFMTFSVVWERAKIHTINLPLSNTLCHTHKYTHTTEHTHTHTHAHVHVHAHTHAYSYTVPTPTQTEKKSVHLRLCFFRVTDTNEPNISLHAVISHFLWLAACGHGYKYHNRITIGNICSVFSYKFTHVNKQFIGTDYFQKTVS